MKKTYKEQTSMRSFVNRKVKEYGSTLKYGGFENIEIGLELEMQQNNDYVDEYFNIYNLEDNPEYINNVIEWFSENNVLQEIIDKWGIRSDTGYNPHSTNPYFILEYDGSLQSNEGYETKFEFKTPKGIKVPEQLLFFKNLVELNNKKGGLKPNDSCGMHVNISDSGDIVNLNLLVLYELFNEHYYKYNTRMKIPKRDIDQQYKREYDNLVSGERERDNLELKDVTFGIFILKIFQLLEKSNQIDIDMKSFFNIMKEGQQEVSHNLSTRIDRNIIDYLDSEQYQNVPSPNTIISKRFGFPVKGGMIQEIMNDVSKIQSKNPQLKQLFTNVIKRIQQSKEDSISVSDKNKIFYLCQQSILLDVDDDNLNSLDNINKQQVQEIDEKIHKILEKVGKNRKIVNKNFFYQKNIDKLVQNEFQRNLTPDEINEILNYSYDEFKELLYSRYLNSIENVTDEKYRSLTIKSSCVEFRIIGGDYLKMETYDYIKDLQKIFLLQVRPDEETISFVEKRQINKIKKILEQKLGYDDVRNVMDVI